jgi:protoporphyrinogen oxidase
MRVAIIGGGLTGLSAALALAEGGAEVVLFERDRTLGGLAGSFLVGEAQLERFYHHIFTSDLAIQELIARFGLSSRLVWVPTTTSYYAGRIYRLATPLDVLRFSPLPFHDRIRLGLLAVQARFVRTWEQLEDRTARDWVVSLAGERVYRQVWEPLLRGKFGPYADEISAVWMWNKVKLRGSSRGRTMREVLGYLEGGFGQLVDCMEQRLQELGADVRPGQPAQEILRHGSGFLVRSGEASERFDQVLVTTAPAILLELAPWLPEDYAQQLRSIEYLANVCAVLSLSRRLSNVYWLNISDNSVPFVGLVEHTNIQEPERYGGRHLVYLTRYCQPHDRFYALSDEELVGEYLPHLQKLFPEFRPEWVVESFVWRERYTQPVIRRNYSRVKPSLQTPVPKLWLCCMAQVYPEDRGMNYAVVYGQRVAREMLADGR